MLYEEKIFQLLEKMLQLSFMVEISQERKSYYKNKQKVRKK
jgi:hypothetical protein